MSLVEDIDVTMGSADTLSRAADSDADMTGVTRMTRSTAPAVAAETVEDMSRETARPATADDVIGELAGAKIHDGTGGSAGHWAGEHADATVTALRRHIRRDDHERRAIDRVAAQQAVADLLTALGHDASGPHLAETPRRVADALIEMTTPDEFDLTTFPNDEGYDDMVVSVDIPLHSLCEHHLLPFFGVAHIAYVPGQRILGISKLARVAEMFARDLQVQERLTTQIADWLDDNLRPQGVGVVITAEHLCQSLRGVKSAGTRTVTSALRGSLRSDDRTRHEFLALARSHGTAS